MDILKNECLRWGNTQNKKIFLVEVNPPQSWPWKQNRNHSCGCYDDSQNCEQMKKHVTDKYFEKKVRLWTLITSC